MITFAIVFSVVLVVFFAGHVSGRVTERRRALRMWSAVQADWAARKAKKAAKKLTRHGRASKAEAAGIIGEAFRR
jgi:hypothetical protein